ncbi:MAG: hypothetical protein ACRC7O_16025 [Fimbriiglobus sp.]
MPAVIASYAGCVLGVALLVVVADPTKTTEFAHDTLYNLSVGHRLYEGARPYVDFHLGHGPLTFQLVEAGIAVAGVSFEALRFAQALAVLLLGTICFGVCSLRLPLFWTIVVTLTATCVLGMPTHLGAKVWREFGYAMIYNKMSFVLFGCVVVACLFPPRAGTRTVRGAGAVLDGVALGLLAATKVSFAGVALGLYVLARAVWVERGDTRRVDFLISMAAMVGVFAALFAACGGTFSSYMSSVAVFKKMWDAPVIMLVLRYTQYTNMIFYTGVVCLLAYLSGLRAIGPTLPLVRNAVLCTAAAVGFLVVTSTCAQSYDVIPFLGLVPLAAVSCVYRLVPHRDRELVAVPVAAVGALLMFVAFQKDAALSAIFSRSTPASLTASLPDRAKGGPAAGEAPSAAPLPDAIRYIADPGMRKDIVDALSLTQRCGCADGDKLYVGRTVDFITMFTPCRYPRGPRGVYAWHLIETPPVKAVLPELYGDDFLADTKWILRYTGDDDIWERIRRTRAGLSTQFQEVGRQGRWILLSRVTDRR